MNSYQRRDLTGILLLDKPLELSSHTALKKTQRLFNAAKAGHTGSLDPKATGMLPICFGEATKFTRFLLEADKCYETKIQLGITTTTGDAEGQVLCERSVPELTSSLIKTMLEKFTGAQTQIPPMYSALKHQGQPLYKLARAGKTIVREPRNITIHSLQCTAVLPTCITLRVICSKGTYIRTLAEDIGELWGCGAHVVMLDRTWLFPFEKHSSVSLKTLEEIDLPGREAFLIPLKEALTLIFPSVQLSNASALLLRQGQWVNIDSAPAGWICLEEDGQFLGLGEVLGNQIRPRRLLSTNQ